MDKTVKPELIKKFENMLWVHSPKNWIFQTTYSQDTLFVSILIETSRNKDYQKIRRSFHLDIISSFISDLWGMASDCIDEMKTETKGETQC